jgi:hypothetical protein
MIEFTNALQWLQLAATMITLISVLYKFGKQHGVQEGINKTHEARLDGHDKDFEDINGKISVMNKDLSDKIGKIDRDVSYIKGKIENSNL